jgi:NAD(P)-dependent dehydrogenase (short-subunit alcohol dehydrogenase family)
MAVRTALVTGAGGGIGRATALEFAQRGFRTYLAGRTESALQDVAALCEGGGHPIVADISSQASVAQLFDVLFNNAGTNTPALPFDELPAEDLVDVININLIGSLLCAREAFAIMKSQNPHGGRIINNGSVSAYGPRPKSVAYTASKHGVTGLTKSLILDGRDFGISASQIDIGNAASLRTARMERGVEQADGSVRTEPRMDLDLVARTVADMATLPADINMPFVTLMPTLMPLYGRG